MSSQDQANQTHKCRSFTWRRENAINDKANNNSAKTITSNFVKPSQTFSTSGFFPQSESPRQVFDFNGGWLFLKGSCEKAERVDFDDSAWQTVCLPHSVELLPEDASGSINYQGDAWYRKSFQLPHDTCDQRVVIDFEAIQGHSQIYLNGKLIRENHQGYLPVVMDITEHLLPYPATNVIAVKTDNRDDPHYPAGKNQCELDFTYVGGIYRDVWLYTTAKTYITHEQIEDKVAGGGLHVSYRQVSEVSAAIDIHVNLCNEAQTGFAGQLQLSLTSCQTEQQATTTNQPVKFKDNAHITASLQLSQPELWHPDSPNLYWLECSIIDTNGNVVDHLRTRIGIKSLTFDKAAGLSINGRPIEKKLIGVNRHQFHAYIGTALANSQHWQDVKLLKEANVDVIRTGHYPQDPAFLDAADELGVLVIQPSIGWQFWNDEDSFVQQAYTNVRQKIRRDRNRACLWMFEPALNETHQPQWFLKTLQNIVHEECHQDSWVPLDSYIESLEHCDLIYAHPNQMKTDEPTNKGALTYRSDIDKPIFTREWGDNVDDWNSHNSNSRVHRCWGETAQVIQALHYGVGSGQNQNEYATNLNVLHQAPPQHIGGTLWHAFDHQRGYHPEQFWGGIMDAFRQPKYSYHLFKAQQETARNGVSPHLGYHLKILHEASPISSPDITVVGNVDYITLEVAGKSCGKITIRNDKPGIPFLPATFTAAFDFMDFKTLHREERFDEACIIARGFVDGECVIKEVKYPAKRPTRINLTVSQESLIANGSDMLTIIAEVTDEDGNVKRLARDKIQFEVFGEASLVDNHDDANPRIVEWGSAPAIIRSTQTAGDVIVIAKPFREGMHSLVPAMLRLSTRDNPVASLQNQPLQSSKLSSTQLDEIEAEFKTQQQRRINRNQYLRAKLRGVELQQSECGEFNF